MLSGVLALILFINIKSVSLDKIYQHDCLFKFNPKTHKNWNLIAQDQDPQFCGQGFKDLRTTYVMGGHNAQLGQFPWLGYLKPIGCGCTIISKRYVLTAAHCVRHSKPESVVIGQHKLNTVEFCEKGRCSIAKTIEVENYTMHEKHLPGKNDIALLRLAQEIQFNEFAVPICLPIYRVMADKHQELFVKNGLEVAGWGYVTKIPRQERATILQTVKVHVESSTHCTYKHGKDLTNPKLTICHDTRFGKGTCQGDSGGPVMYKDEIQGPMRFFLVGINSHGGACDPHYGSSIPNVACRVSAYLKWVLNHIAP